MESLVVVGWDIDDLGRPRAGVCVYCRDEKLWARDGQEKWRPRNVVGAYNTTTADENDTARDVVSKTQWSSIDRPQKGLGHKKERALMSGLGGVEWAEREAAGEWWGAIAWMKVVEDDKSSFSGVGEAEQDGTGGRNLTSLPNPPACCLKPRSTSSARALGFKLSCNRRYPHPRPLPRLLPRRLPRRPSYPNVDVRVNGDNEYFAARSSPSPNLSLSLQQTTSTANTHSIFHSAQREEHAGTDLGYPQGRKPPPPPPHPHTASSHYSPTARYSSIPTCAAAAKRQRSLVGKRIEDAEKGWGAEAGTWERMTSPDGQQNERVRTYAAQSSSCAARVCAHPVSRGVLRAGGRRRVARHVGSARERRLVPSREYISFLFIQKTCAMSWSYLERCQTGNRGMYIEFSESEILSKEKEWSSWLE
ncbi:hypothetical protein C8F04DRAFT_1177332 [Mycena alexandri]|uniref:Uncharacterized protein n=1 Tax=Mycena alexandri TaxID=1745969 RepID=A0AAD6XAA7_9AGAR|nr:hypothetical protein C8F04DRAFT_1177332 [Mycena alexandri]